MTDRPGSGPPLSGRGPGRAPVGPDAGPPGRCSRTTKLNRRRRAEGKSPATSIWLWGQGRPPRCPPSRSASASTGAVICAVDLIRGIGLYAGLTPILVPGATGYLDTNYQGKVDAALDGLEAEGPGLHPRGGPGRSRPQGELKLKLQAIEDFDAKVVGPLLSRA